ncbi:MAG: TonB family protein [Candidatus Methylomirabilales bacterium]
MVAAADRFFPPGPTSREVWLTFGLSVLVHALLTIAIVMIPRFQVGTYIQVPVSYTVSLVSAPPGGAPPAGATSAAPPAPARVPPAPAARPAPRPTEELTLPGRRPPAKSTQEREPSLRPPSVIGKETARPAPPTPTPLTPAVPAIPQPAAPVASAGAGAGTAKTSGVEVAGTASGAGTGAGSGTALNYYLTLVDRKIYENWVPLGASGSPETVVVVRFRVLRSGQVRNVELETSSGSASVDTSALRAVRQSIPLPPFPNLLTEEYLDLRYRFVMERG